MKKIFNQPTLKVVRVKDDIIATSNYPKASIGDDVNNENDILVGERHGWDEF